MLLLLPGTAWAQVSTSYQIGTDTLQLTLGGTIQPRASYGWITNADDERQRVGFGLRRVRVRLNVAVGPRAGFFTQFAGASGTFQPLDAYAYYRFRNGLRLRLGRMASAQPRAFQLTSHTRIDAVDRSGISQLWSRGTLGGSGRDIGLDLSYSTANADVILFFGNGDESWDRVRGNYREAIIGDVTRGADRDPGRLAAAFYGAFRPEGVSGLEVGGFIGFNGSENPNTEANGLGRSYGSYSAHVYWGANPGSQPVRLKADVIGIQYEGLSAVEPQGVFGVALTGAVRIHRAAEAVVIAEHYDPDADVDDDALRFFTAGASLSLSALRGRPYRQERLTLAFSTRRPEDGDAPRHQLLVLQAQVFF